MNLNSDVNASVVEKKSEIHKLPSEKTIKRNSAYFDLPPVGERKKMKSTWRGKGFILPLYGGEVLLWAVAAPLATTDKRRFKMSPKPCFTRSLLSRISLTLFSRPAIFNS
jgi:hypothetical protein